MGERPIAHDLQAVSIAQLLKILQRVLFPKQICMGTSCSS